MQDGKSQEAGGAAASVRSGGAAVSDAARAFVLPAEGLGMLVRERSLRRMAVVPLLLGLLALLGAGGVLASFGGDLHAWATGLAPALEVGAWYTWIWVGPLRAVFWLLGQLLFLAMVALSLVLALVVASVVASPFHDELAKRVERLVLGQEVDESGDGLAAIVREGARSVREELRRLLFFAGV